MANLGSRILLAIANALADPALRSQVEANSAAIAANSEADAADSALIATVAERTTALADQVAAFAESLAENDSLDGEQQAQLESIQAVIDSLSEAFPEQTVEPPVEEPGEPEEPVSPVDEPAPEE
jgi:hypothetical protein